MDIKNCDGRLFEEQSQMGKNILLEQLSKIPEIKLNKNPNSEWMNGECITCKPHQRLHII